jgi:hypothetical protein
VATRKKKDYQIKREFLKRIKRKKKQKIFTYINENFLFFQEKIDYFFLGEGKNKNCS